MANSDKVHIKEAVVAAQDAFDNVWLKSSANERSNMLLNIADIIKSNIDCLVQIKTIDSGKAIREYQSTGDVNAALPANKIGDHKH